MMPRRPTYADLAAPREGLQWAMTINNDLVWLRIRGGKLNVNTPQFEMSGRPSNREIVRSLQELCGVLHASMGVRVRVVEEDEVDETTAIRSRDTRRRALRAGVPSGGRMAARRAG